MRTVADDRSLIWNLGRVSFAAAGASILPSTPGAETIHVQRGDVCLIHTLDRNTDQWAKMEILAWRPIGIVFRWATIAATPELARVAAAGRRELSGPLVHVQLRAGTRSNGNPNRVFLDGSKNAYLDRIAGAPIPFAVPVTAGEEGVAWLDGGLVPEGQTWVVTQVEGRVFSAHTTPGSRHFAVQLLDQTVLQRDGDDAGGTTHVRWTGEVAIHRGDEARCFVEVAGTTACDVWIRGHFRP
ncbi:MAG: hypothetical protein AAF628_17540 [Planctomycetota bacterium]